MGFRYRYSRNSFSIKSRCKMNIVRDVQIVMQILGHAHGSDTIYLLHTVDRSRSTASTVASLSGNSDTHIHTCTATRNHGLHAPYARTPVNRSGNNSYDYFYDPCEKSGQTPEAVNLRPRRYSCLSALSFCKLSEIKYVMSQKRQNNLKKNT
jgi:hypothetical protein